MNAKIIVPKSVEVPDGVNINSVEYRSQNRRVRLIVQDGGVLMQSRRLLSPERVAEMKGSDKKMHSNQVLVGRVLHTESLISFYTLACFADFATLLYSNEAVGASKRTFLYDEAE